MLIKFSLDASLAFHPCLCQCSPTACWLYICCLAHTKQYQTAGFIDDKAIPHVSHVRRASKASAELVASGLLVRADHGYFVKELTDLSTIPTGIR